MTKSELVDNSESRDITRSIQQYQLKSLIAKKIVHHLYFTHDRFDLCFELLLTILETEKKYSSYFTGIVEKDATFSNKIVTYQNKTKLELDKQALICFSDIYSLLQKIKNHQQLDAISIFFTYCQILQRISEVQETITNIERWSSFQSLIEKQVAEIANLYNFPSYDQQLNCNEVAENWIDDEQTNKKMLFKMLLQAIWDKTFYKQVHAVKALIKIANSSMLTSMSDDIQHLLQAVAFHIFTSPKINEYVSENGEITELEVKYLPLFLAQYISSPKTWQALYSIGTIESGLYLLINRRGTGVHDVREQPQFKENLANFRKTEQYNSQLSQTIRGYLALKNKTAYAPLKKDSTEAIECQGYVDTLQEICIQESLVDNQYYNYIFTELLLEMSEMVIPI